MNLPNKITMLRVALIPIFLLLIYQGGKSALLWGLFVFIFASATDFLDGYIARKYKLVTDFGKFADPLADKLLVASALIYFVGVGAMHSSVCFIIIAREFIVTGLRIVAVEKNRVIAASPSGKLKTVIQMVGIVVLLLLLALKPSGSEFIVVLVNILMAAVTLYSGGEYIIKNFDIISQAK